jgi:RNA recognition motif-containing protein
MKCRVLAFNKQQLGDSKKHESNGVFVKGFPKNWTHEDLYKVFEKFGKVFSAKVSVEDGKESRGYGFVSMETSEAMQKALEGLNDKSLEEIQF